MDLEILHFAREEDEEQCSSGEDWQLGGSQRVKKLLQEIENSSVTSVPSQWISVTSSKLKAFQGLFDYVIEKRKTLSPTFPALIDGKTVEFDTIENKFDALVVEWMRIRESGSSTDTFFNDAYGQVVAMGQSVVPFLLLELQRQGAHWVTALTWITGIDLATPEIRGNSRKMRHAWIDWGIKNGHIK